MIISTDMSVRYPECAYVTKFTLLQQLCHLGFHLFAEGVSGCVSSSPCSKASLIKSIVRYLKFPEFSSTLFLTLSFHPGMPCFVARLNHCLCCCPTLRMRLTVCPPASTLPHLGAPLLPLASKWLFIGSSVRTSLPPPCPHTDLCP